MGVLDEIARIKAARRAELAEAEAEQQRVAEQAHRDSLARLDAAVRDTLAGQSASWLAEYRSPLGLSAEMMPVLGKCLVVDFVAPGHRRVGLEFRRVEEARGEWVLSLNDDGEWCGWFADEGTHFPRFTWLRTLADALIAAEIDGWVPPAPVESEDGHSPEVMHQARMAWEAMTQAVEPMPALMALGMVEEETGHDVDAAVSAIHLAAGEWLDRLRPEQAVDEEADGFFAEQVQLSVAIRGYLNAEEYVHADNCRLEIHKTCREIQCQYIAETTDRDQLGEEYMTTTQGEMNRASEWRTWCDHAARAIDLCRAVAAAAHPEPASAT